VGNIYRIPAASLGRNYQVIIDPDDHPYLVDSVSELPDGGVRVTYSSGDIIEYTPDAVVNIL
jgi:hypothetical protein